MYFFLIFQGSFNPKIIFLGQKVCSVAREQTHTKVNTKDVLSWFQDFFYLSSGNGPIREAGL